MAEDDAKAEAAEEERPEAKLFAGFEPNLSALIGDDPETTRFLAYVRSGPPPPPQRGAAPAERVEEAPVKADGKSYDDQPAAPAAADTAAAPAQAGEQQAAAAAPMQACYGRHVGAVMDDPGFVLRVSSPVRSAMAARSRRVRNPALRRSTSPTKPSAASSTS